MNGRTKTQPRRGTGLAPAEISAIGAIAEERVQAGKTAGPPETAVAAFNERHRALPVTREDFTSRDPAKAGRIALFFSEYREAEIARVRAAWSAEPLRREALADGRLSAEDITAIGLEVRHKIGAADRKSPVTTGRDGREQTPPVLPQPGPVTPPAATSPAAFVKAAGLTVAEQESADRLARRMYHFEGWAAGARVDGFAVGERDLAEANRLIAADSRYTGLRPISAADLRVAPADGSVNAARLVVYRTLAEQTIRDESAGVRAEKAKPFLGTWADGPVDDGFRDPREKGVGAKIGGFFKGVGRAATYQESRETIEAREAEARLVARLGPASAGNRDWVARAEGQGAVVEQARLRGMAEALSGHVYRDRGGRPVEAHHVPFIEAAAVRIAGNLNFAPPSSEDLERFNREANGGRAITARDLAAMPPDSRMPFARWYASELWEQAIDRYAEANRGLGKGKYPERTATATAAMLERVIEETSRRNGAEFSRLVADASLKQSRDDAYLAATTAPPPAAVVVTGPAPERPMAVARAHPNELSM